MILGSDSNYDDEGIFMDEDEVLIRIFEEYPNAIDDAKLFKALLSDYFMGDKKSRNMYSIFADEFIICEMAKKDIVEVVDFHRYAQRVINDYGYAKEQIQPYMECLVDSMQAAGIIEDYELDWFWSEEDKEEFERMSEKLNEMNNKLAKVTEMISDGESENEDESDEDDEFKSIKHLFERKKTRLIIVKKANWNNDYCMVVDFIRNGWAYGRCYRNGKPYKEDKQGANVEAFKLYDGPSEAMIRKDHISVRDDIRLGASLKEFWENRGFEVVDERAKKKNGYLFVKGSQEELEPYVQIVREAYDVKGRFQTCRVFNYEWGWGTISSK